MTFWIGGGMIVVAGILYAVSAICWDLKGMGFAVVVGVIGLAIFI